MTHCVKSNLPVTSFASLDTVESLLSDDDSVSLHQCKLLVSMIFRVLPYLFTGGYSYSYAIRKALFLCFNKDMLIKFSYHGRSKKSLKSKNI